MPSTKLPPIHHSTLIAVLRAISKNDQQTEIIDELHRALQTSNQGVEGLLQRALLAFQHLSLPIIQEGSHIRLVTPLTEAYTTIHYAFGEIDQPLQRKLTQKIADATPQQPLNLPLYLPHQPTPFTNKQKNHREKISYHFIIAVYGDTKLWDRKDIYQDFPELVPQRGLEHFVTTYYTGNTLKEQSEQLTLEAFAHYDKNKPLGRSTLEAREPNTAEQQEILARIAAKKKIVPTYSLD
ncbi:MAG: hypothetical protein Q7R56_00140 [Nanoarchaeota archaeon]|nr:hypothetical protein [Nanoarchaeota archaeon]